MHQDLATVNLSALNVFVVQSCRKNKLSRQLCYRAKVVDYGRCQCKNFWVSFEEHGVAGIRLPLGGAELQTLALREGIHNGAM